MNFLRNLVLPLTANDRAQRLISNAAESLQALAGIGMVADPAQSGERALVDLLAAKEGPLIVFDVGANVGGFSSLVLDRLEGRTLSLHCFEPGKTAFAKLREKLRGCADVHLNNCALGAACGQRQLYFYHEGSSLASLTRRRLDHFRGGSRPEDALEETVDVTTLDDYLARRGLDRIDLLKIDVEGHEMDVLNGAANALRDGKIRFLTFEFGGCNIDTRTYFRDFWYFFRNFPGASIFRLTPSGFLHRIAKYRESHEIFRAANYLVTF
jgi:FkbM family methyltransferase